MLYVNFGLSRQIVSQYVISYNILPCLGIFNTILHRLNLLLASFANMIFCLPSFLTDLNGKAELECRVQGGEFEECYSFSRGRQSESMLNYCVCLF